MRCQHWILGQRQCQQPATRNGLCDWHRDEQLERRDDARTDDPPCPRSSPSP